MLSPLRSRDFRLLWIGQSVSVIGDGLVIVAVGLFVTRLTGDPGDVGVVLAGYSVPLVLLLLAGGVVADRLPRQWVMVVSDTVRSVAHLTLALATGLVLTVGGAAAFALDGITFAVSAFTLLRVRPRSRGISGMRAGLLEELREGATAVRARGWVWATIAGFSLAILVALGPFFVLGPAVSRQVYGTDAVYGIASAFWGGSGR